MKRPAWLLLFLAAAAALIATAAAFFLGEVMGMAPCTLCWYQRIAMFPLVPILSLACLANDRRGVVYGLVLAWPGLLVAAYHTLLVGGLLPQAWVPCGAGPSCLKQDLSWFGGLQLPWLSLLAFALIVVLLSLVLKKTAR
ncbi:disulfide bond formation protein B [Hylemonella gracilis]|jgi:disulfide bond formation protein DsbB|uniref:Disulfide bond formation protein B n=2 Tax=Hylemonella gracilis TaxID=80880 RepID=A0A4P6UQW8_9BURK|nr:disulfide bond formation protein B [Hylemonella gracilis]